MNEPTTDALDEFYSAEVLCTCGQSKTFFALDPTPQRCKCGLSLTLSRTDGRIMAVINGRAIAGRLTMRYYPAK